MIDGLENVGGVVHKTSGGRVYVKPVFEKCKGMTLD